MAEKAKGHELKLKVGEGETKGRVLAGKIFGNAVNGAVLVTEYSGSLYGEEVNLSDWLEIMGASIEGVQENDLRNVEAILTGQVLALDAIFTNLARKANLNNRMDQLELCMRLALKAQNQCRATAQALAAIKNPQQTVFMKQANIANGPQQVNNGPIDDDRNTDGKAQKKNNSLKNKLLTADEKGERLDTGTTGKAGGDNTEMEAVGAVNRAKNRGRKGKSGAERL
jgi:hypothetical protein